MFAPGASDFCTFTVSEPASVNSTWTTVSAPSGTNAPVMMRIAVPGSTRNDGTEPAGTSPITRNDPGRSAARTA
jgi:hypothetical protein